MKNVEKYWLRSLYNCSKCADLVPNLLHFDFFQSGLSCAGPNAFLKKKIKWRIFFIVRCHTTTITFFLSINLAPMCNHTVDYWGFPSSINFAEEMVRLIFKFQGWCRVPWSSFSFSVFGNLLSFGSHRP